MFEASDLTRELLFFVQLYLECGSLVGGGLLRVFLGLERCGCGRHLRLFGGLTRAGGVWVGGSGGEKNRV